MKTTKGRTINAAEFEASKDATKRAEDWAYVVNHALVCTATDFVDIPLSHFLQNLKNVPAPLKPFLSKVHIGCGHHHHEATGMQVSMGELVGDFGSVPVVLAAQRLAPGLMHSMEKIVEPVVGPAFHASAEAWSKPWAKRRGFSYDSTEYKQHVEELYHHEMEHLPQAALWTVSSVGLNAVTQKALGNENPWSKIIAAKAIGAGITSGLVVGARLLAPKAVRQVDKASTKYVFAPATKYIGGLLGIQDEAIENVLEQEGYKQEITWQKRLKEAQAENDLAAEPSAMGMQR